eukprot:gene10274-10433_t
MQHRVGHKLADTRSKAAAAAMAAAASNTAYTDGERSAMLAARMLDNMQAAERRRLEAREAQRARLAARNELVMTRLDLSPHSAANAATFRVTRSSKQLQRSWRAFASQRKTSAQLAQSFAGLGVTGLDHYGADAVPLLAPPPHLRKQAAQGPQAAAAGSLLRSSAADGAAPASPGVVLIGGLSSGSPSPGCARFEDFAAKLQSPDTLRAGQALLRRLDQRLSARGSASDNVQSLLRQLSPSTPTGRKLDRYPVRVLLCAYMIKEHPEVVFNKVGDVEARLSAAGSRMLAAFEELLARLLQPLPGSLAAAGAASCPSPLTKSMTSYVKAGRAGPRSAPEQQGTTAARRLFAAGDAAAEGQPAAAGSAALATGERDPTVSTAAGGALGSGAAAGGSSLATLLVNFDDFWLEYLDQFVVWKGHDAAALEVELMRMAVRLERSMRLKLGRRELGSPEVAANPDLQAMINQVSHDHALLADRIARLTGPEGSARLAAALEHNMMQPICDAKDDGSGCDSIREALAAAQQVAQPQSSSTTSASEANSDSNPEADTLSNEQMVWEMLYNPAYLLSTSEAEAAWHRALGKAADEPEAFAMDDLESLSPEQLTAVISNRARLIAEKAFWDSLVWRFKTAVQGQALPSQLATLLSELGTELSGFVAEPLEAQQLAEQLAALAKAMKERGAVSYLQTKLSAVWQLSAAAGEHSEGADASDGSAQEGLTAARVAEKLPKTAAWLEHVQAGLVPQLQTGLQGAGLLLDTAAAMAAVVAGGLQSMELRSGVRASPAAVSSGSPAAVRSPGRGSGATAAEMSSLGIKAVFPVELKSWQGVTRAGLLALGRAQARRRLLVVLSDPGMKLSHLVTELSQLAGGNTVAPERQVANMFTTIVNPEAAAFRSIRNALACALAAHLLYGRGAVAADGAVAAGCLGLLGRVGAAALAEDVADLGARLAAVAAVNEVVHRELLALLTPLPAGVAA